MFPAGIVGPVIAVGAVVQGYEGFALCGWDFGHIIATKPTTLVNRYGQVIGGVVQIATVVGDRGIVGIKLQSGPGTGSQWGNVERDKIKITAR
ncbi:hypothetical protein BGP_5654 [Beggiatoa sp. PS]|nr:hypothetical protein BGP_5654 [Beggiatoa sp. PS]